MFFNTILAIEADKSTSEASSDFVLLWSIFKESSELKCDACWAVTDGVKDVTCKPFHSPITASPPRKK